MLVPNFPPNHLPIMDSAPYLSIHMNKTLTLVLKKEGIQDWFQRNNIHYGEEITKTELLQHVQVQHIPQNMSQIPSYKNTVMKP
jgi:hypothetical protein